MLRRLQKLWLPINPLQTLGWSPLAEVWSLCLLETQSKDSAFKYLVKFKDRLTVVKGTSKEKMLVQQLESTAADIVKNKRSQDKLVKLAPKLASKLVEFARYKSKQRDQGRDL